MNPIPIALLAMLSLSSVVPYVPHPVILIQSDTELAPGGVPNHAMGVHGGSGTDEDPYYIDHLRISSPGFTVFPQCSGICTGDYYPVNIPAVTIRNTRSPLLLDHLILKGRPLLTPPLYHVGNSPNVIRIDNSENIVIDHVLLENATLGIDIRNSKNITIRHLDTSKVLDGISVFNSDVVIRESRFSSVRWGVTVSGSSSLGIHDSNFDESGWDAVFSVHPSIPMDLRWNWWGCPTGPNTSGCESVVGGQPVYEPWLTERAGGAGYVMLCPTPPLLCDF